MRNGSCLRSGHKPWGNLGRSRAAGTRGAECGGMARGSQQTPRSGMNLFLGTVLLLLLLPDVAKGQDSCSELPRGDEHHECCSVVVEQQSPGSSTRTLHLSRHCPELWRSGSRACACLRERWLRLLQQGRQSWLAGLKTLLLNVSRAVTRDVLVTFSPTEGPSRLNTTEEGKAGKIHLPREIFRSLSSQTVRVVVTVLNIQQLGMFKEVNQTAQVLDNTVVGITVGESSISGLRHPVQLTFAHRELPQGVTPRCVFWDARKGQAGGWRSSGCVTQPGDEGTVCSCDHLTFFTLLLNPALDGSTAKALMAVATAGCGVAVAFSIFTMAFCIFVRCRFRFEQTVRTNLGLHVNLVGSLFLLNLAFLLNSGLSGRTHPRACGVLGGLTHYCLLCCFTWMALEGCQLYLLFVKVLGTYIHHYLAKLCLLGWGFPVLVVGVAGAIGSYGEYSIQTMDHQVLDHFQTSSGPLHHQLWLLRPHLPLQHGCLRGGDPEELQLAGHWGSAGTPQALEGGSGGSRALLPAGSHLGPGIPHLWRLLCSCGLHLHHPQLSPRNLHIHLVGRPLLPKDKGDHWFPLLHHQT
ncbi:adhesion G protein-coupled receptor G3 isoform X2 [Motacilla alba alba]|uniref:adhesion G protein-coupled receptor G3 isoform X2 n=1 Tax=Motacilla alba alba TaxID=1094192 RepID=UPI0018D4FB6F|nr:adhesion G protein-coupled receptor G3 isoform X2 [Motacilla alba alba]